MTPNRAQRLEGLAVFIAAIALYGRTERSWWIYTAAATFPDLSIAAYLFGRRVGATVYNTVHMYVWPVALGVIAIVGGASGWLAIAIGWASHIGLDRALGFGLKYPTSFKETHLSKAAGT